MNRKSLLRAAAIGMSLTLTVGATATLLTGCKKTSISNEKTPFVLSTDRPDGVFNPFFYTAGADGEIIGQTQIGMLSSNAQGLLIAGEDEPCVAQAFGIDIHGTPDDTNIDLSTGIDHGYYTDYYFAIKEGIKFSDGQPLTIKDVLFNIYMYLDPAYTGSSTMYSVDIQGLAAYRTQSADVSNQEGFNSYFSAEADKRIDSILQWADDDYSVFSDESFAGFEADAEDGKPHLRKDIEKVHELFKEELESDWNGFQDDSLLEDYRKYGFTANWEIFLLEEGIIKVDAQRDPDTKKITGYDVDYGGTENLPKDKNTLVQYVYDKMICVDDFNSTRPADFDAYKENLATIVLYYQTGRNLKTALTSEAISMHFQGDLEIRTVSGITVLPEKVDKMPVTTYSLDEDGHSIFDTDKGSDGEGAYIDKAHNKYTVLKIRINGVDPKAIQNFGFTVAPGHYYSSTWNKFYYDTKADPDNLKSYFGVEFGSSEFMDNVKKNQIPLGAGPYRVTKEKGSKPEDNITKGDFFANGGTLVYLQRNDDFMLGAPKIKYLRYQSISTTQLYEATKNQIHFSMPTVKPEYITKLNNEDKDKLEYIKKDNLGYGYIGINATYVPELEIRQAIMHAMDISLCESYFGKDNVQLIYRPMSRTLDYYPEDITEQYYKFDPSGQTSLDLALDAGYRTDSNGNLKKNGKALKFTFTIAGESDDHPAYETMKRAAEILNEKGFDITVQTSSSALSKLAAGQLAVWAAAWSSSSDPDMYQVYHKDSSATSTDAWGYPYLTSNASDPEERKIINDLSILIEEGRESLDFTVRKPIYKRALEEVMKLAVELPTYQRDNLYVFRKGFFDEETMKLFDQATAFQSPLSKIWLVGYNKG